jgi:hypothetical protein
MNERLKELAEQAGVIFDSDPTYTYGASPKVLEHFAKLVRQDEREACAKLLNDFAKTSMVPVKDTWRMGVMAAANAVRDKK